MKNILQLTSVEQQMLHEVFDVISKFKGSTRDFNIQLTHLHFPLTADEILYETHNVANRTLKVQPIKASTISRQALETAWMRDEGGNLTATMFCCEGSGGDDGPPDGPHS